MVVLVVFGGNDRLDAQVHQVLVNPIGSVSLIAAQGHGPSDGLPFPIEETAIAFFQQRVQNRRLMALAWRQMEVERIPIPVAENVTFRRKTPARTA